MTPPRGASLPVHLGATPVCGRSPVTDLFDHTDDPTQVTCKSCRTAAAATKSRAAVLATVAQHQPICGADIFRLLRPLGLAHSTVYHAVAALEAAHQLSSSWDTNPPRPRRMLVLTGAGKQSLKELVGAR